MPSKLKGGIRQAHTGKRMAAKTPIKVSEALSKEVFAIVKKL